jgi:hypothetical protein
MTDTRHEGEIYECTHSNDLFKVVDYPDVFGTYNTDDQTVEIERVTNGEWFAVYRDNFEKRFQKVADSKDDL